jgi:chitodextrinase
LSWKASTDNNGVNAYEIYQGISKIATVTGSGGAAPVTTYEITGLTANTKYTFTVKAVDAAGNVSTSSSTMTVTTMKGDAQAPTKPAGLSFSSVSSDTVTLTWTASTDNFGVKAYEVYEGATLFETITVTDSQNSTVTYQVTNLQPGSSYTFYVKAKDAAGISSDVSTPINVTTTDPENQAPTAISIDNNSIDENSWLGFTVGTLTATDADAGDTFTYALVEGEGDTDNASFTIVGDQLKVASELDYIEDYTYSVCVQVTDDGGLSYAQMIELDVIQANVALNDAYNQLTVYFEDNFFNNKTNLQALKGEITMTSNAESESPTYSALPEGSSVAIKTNTLLIKFNPPLPATTANYRIKIAALALRDAFNNKSQEQISSSFSIDGAGPKVVSVKVNKKKNFITIRFNKKATIASEGINLKAKQTAFKNSIQFKRTGGDYAALGAKDVVKVFGHVMTIKLASVLTTTDNDLKIATNQLQDIGFNKSGELNMKVNLDTTGPMFHKVAVASKNKVIRILFKDGALNAFSGPTRTSLLKAAVKFSTDGGVNYAAFAENDKVELVSGNKNGLMIITLGTAISGTQNRIRINTDALKDSFKNLNTMLETSLFAADEVGPIHSNAPKQVVVLAKSSNKSIAVIFNERVFNGSTAAKPAERLAALKNAVTIMMDADAESPTYVPLSATDKVTVRGKQLRISLAKSLPSDKKFKVKIAEGVVADQVGNTTLAIETEMFETDKSGPKLR